MALQIIILNTNIQSDGSFSVSGVFWLTAPANHIIPIINIKSQIPNITIEQLSLLQNGTIVERPFNTGLYTSNTTTEDIQANLEQLFASEQTKLNNSSIISNGFIGSVYDGNSWALSNEPINFQTNQVIVEQPKDSAGIPLTVPEPRKGTEVIYATHNFCDQVSWFGDSIRVNETLTDSGDGYRFNSAHVNWIDMISGRVLDDDGLRDEQASLNPEDPHGYLVVVKADDVVKDMRVPFETSGGDYEVFWDDGYVVFYESQAGKTINASYSYANGSTFYVKPLPGKILNIEAAEADFSAGLIQNDTIEYAVWGFVDAFAPQLLDSNGGPYPSGTKIPIKTGYYKRYTQILREAIGAYPTLTPNAADPNHYPLSYKEFRRVSRGSKTETQSTPFRYATVRDLHSSSGMELRVRLIHNREFDGESATLTFYCTSQDE